MTDRCARADAAAFPTAELVAHIRDNARHPWTPPVGGYTSALGHDVVHGLAAEPARRHLAAERDEQGRPRRGCERYLLR